jgi:peroxiredoxin (alkyl hydroperoxide reductase subunit C)
MSIVGKQAPNFSGTAAKGGAEVEVSLGDYAGKWLVLFFYPLDFTFVCPTEVVAFSDRIADFHAINADVLGVSVDSVHTHLAWMRTPRTQAGVGELNYPLLSDLDKSVAESFDVLDGDIALRGVFIIDPEGMVQAGTVNNLPVGRNIDEVLRTLQGYQHNRETGYVCPANWVQGDKGMAATLEGVKSTIG